jgi:hypothetical protein
MYAVQASPVCVLQEVGPRFEKDLNYAGTRNALGFMGHLNQKSSHRTNPP